MTTPLLRFSLFAVLPLLVLGGCERATSSDADSADTSAEAAGDTIPLAERRAMAGRIVFVAERDGRPQVWAVRPTGQGAAPLTRSAEGVAVYPAAVSPDGSSLLVISTMERGGEHVEQLAVMPLGGGGRAVAIGPASARARSPGWAPDGSWLVFESDRESFRDVYRMGRDGSGIQRLTASPHGNFEPAVSPDGRWIAFASSRDGDAEVYVMRSDGSEPRRVTAFHRDDWGPRWSPDGRTLAFLSNREGADRVFLVAPDGTGLSKLNAASDTAPDRLQAAEADFAWSPDGRSIAWSRQPRGGGARVFITDVVTGETSEVVRPGDGDDAQPAWSPDGRHLAFVSSRGEDDAALWIARADGTGATPLTRLPGAEWLPRWSPR